MAADLEEILLLDASAAVALVVEDHEAHASVMRAVQGSRLGLAGHAWFETYSVLTRLPGPSRRSPAVVLDMLERNFSATVFLSEAATRALAWEFASRGIAGGSVYDAMVGAAARESGHDLLSVDGRARPVYEALGVRARLVR